MYYCAPGEYYDANGAPGALGTAKAAGFKIEGDQRAAAKAKALAEFKAKLEAELTETLEAVTQTTAGAELEIRPFGAHFAIFNSQTGKALTSMMSETDARNFLNQLRSEEEQGLV